MDEPNRRIRDARQSTLTASYATGTRPHSGIAVMHVRSGGMQPRDWHGPVRSAHRCSVYVPALTTQRTRGGPAGRIEEPPHRHLLRGRSVALRMTTTPRAIICGRFPFRGDGRCPCGPGLSCFAPSPGGAGSRPFRASIPIAGAPAGLSPLRRASGCAVTAGPRERADGVRHGPHGERGTVRGAPGFGPLTGPCRPARRSPGAADRRPR